MIRARQGSFRALLAAAGLLLAALVAGATSVAAENPSGWRIRFYAAAVDFGRSEATLDASGYARFDVGAGGGFGLGAEYRFTRRLGLDLGVLSSAGIDVEAGAWRYVGSDWARVDTFTFTPLMVGLDVHLTPDHRADVYVGPVVALIRYGDLVVRSRAGRATTRLAFDDKLAAGATLGVGVPFGRGRWSFEAGLTYLDSRLDGRGDDGLRIERSHGSTVVGAGFGYRFKPRSAG